MRTFNLIAQTAWMAFLVYFLLRRDQIQAMLGDKFWLAMTLIVIISAVLFFLKPGKNSGSK